MSVNIRLVLAASALLAASYYFAKRFRKPVPLQLPYLKFEDGDDSRQRYATDTPALFQIGYERV